MPHYKDGSLATVGDLVRGTTYNRLGVLLRITEAESCNAVARCGSSGSGTRLGSSRSACRPCAPSDSSPSTTTHRLIIS